MGAFFFDQDLIAQVNDNVWPYTTNTGDITLNEDDFIINAVAETSDPFARYALIGDSLEDGILAWLTVGIDQTEDYIVPSRATSHGSYAVQNNDTYTCNATICVVTEPGEPVPVLPQADDVESWTV